MDCRNIAKEIYELANSQELIAPLVKEALSVIDQALDAHGYATHSRPDLIGFVRTDICTAKTMYQ